VAIYSAVLLTPLLLLWGIVDRFFRARSRRRAEARKKRFLEQGQDGATKS
jgi:hypothetical protein